MKKQMTYTTILLAAIMLTGCGENNMSTMFASDTATNGMKEEAPAAAAAEADDHADAEYAEEAPAEAPAEAGEAAEAAASKTKKDRRTAEADMADDLTLDAVLDGDYVTGGDVIGEPEPEPDPDFDNGAEPFVLTAGEWNDNENWGFFANLIHNGTIEFPSYGLNPVNRVAVTVTNGGAPVANQIVGLISGDSTCWTAKTDKNGRAYLFYDNSMAGQELSLITDQAKEFTFTAPALASGQGGADVPTLEFELETENESTGYDLTQVSFILDTTGSMGDEISYLQKDFSAIAEEVAAEGVTFSVNFYKDEGDEYVTSCNPFTDDVLNVQKILNREYASGGGDTPEAVAQILDEVLTKGDWQEDANKIAFLIFDAPPHYGSKEEEMILNAVNAAAYKGIHVVPVVASNAERETELFGRALSIMTNSNYVFLTDDSGVGGSHLEPIIGSYEVELLHDIIVRNINEIAG